MSQHAPTGEITLAMPSGEPLGMACKCGGYFDGAGRCSKAEPTVLVSELLALEQRLRLQKLVPESAGMTRGWNSALQFATDELAAVIRKHTGEKG